MQTALRGIFLTCADPTKTAKFYREIAGLELEHLGNATGGYWKVDRNGMQLAIHGASAFADYADPPDRGSNLSHLYFKIEDQAAFLGHLEHCRVKPYSTDDVVVTVEDPDGRKVMFGTA